MSFLNATNPSDTEQDKSVSSVPKFSDLLWNNNDSESEVSDSGNFLTKGELNFINKLIHSL